MILALAALALLAAVPAAAFAKQAVPAAADPVLEKRLMTLAAGLRCLVCQNQSLADSQAELASDLRNEIREQMRRGASDQDVIDYLVARYGDFVLYRPPLKATTLLLWSGPAILFLLGVMLLVRTVLRRRSRAAEEPISEAARARAKALLGPEGETEQA
ncbi:MAG: cytochrome c-type biogenesis protein CcmH [Betaproteobacteria bacterium]|nr:cytochrome c-type biogenesis protein CcmH [Betaproteobacteria bacterium]MBI2958811.1 cytochrome c-type biogenesis protein CcmH [Betaproteobacteria bacterium]